MHSVRQCRGPRLHRRTGAGKSGAARGPVCTGARTAAATATESIPGFDGEHSSALLHCRPQGPHGAPQKVRGSRAHRLNRRPRISKTARRLNARCFWCHFVCGGIPHDTELSFRAERGIPAPFAHSVPRKVTGSKSILSVAHRYCLCLCGNEFSHQEKEAPRKRGAGSP